MARHFVIDHRIAEMGYRVIEVDPSADVREINASMNQRSDLNGDSKVSTVTTTATFRSRGMGFEFEIVMQHLISPDEEMAPFSLEQSSAALLTRVFYDISLELNDAIRKLGIYLSRPFGVEDLIPPEKTEK